MPNTNDIKRRGFDIESIKKMKPSVVSETNLMNFTISDSAALNYPLIITPKVKDINLNKWIELNRELIDSHLCKVGAILFRGFGLDSIDSFNEFIVSLNHASIKYTNRSSPRDEIKNNIYTSTNHPADQYINMHNEHSYAYEWPLKIAFFCLKKGMEGGETPIADSRLVLSNLSEAVKEKFIKHNVLYVRNLGTGLGVSWQEAFQTDNPSDVEEYCSNYGIKYHWKSNSELRLEFVRPAIRAHPITGELIWFNHAFFFNILSLEKNLQNMLKNHVSDHTHPFLTFYGDGSEIEAEVIEQIRQSYEKTKIHHAWEVGDVLLLDNMLMAHGRNRFVGDREILVSMLDLFRD